MLLLPSCKGKTVEMRLGDEGKGGHVRDGEGQDYEESLGKDPSLWVDFNSR